jgi:predicted Fe-S protein YdhL (DUF1289 family)
MNKLNNKTFDRKDVVASPCIRNCCLNEEDICAGCFRHLDEIIAWRQLNNTEKQQVLQRCQQRKEKA